MEPEPWSQSHEAATQTKNPQRKPQQAPPSRTPHTLIHTNHAWMARSVDQSLIQPHPAPCRSRRQARPGRQAGKQTGRHTHAAEPTISSERPTSSARRAKVKPVAKKFPRVVDAESERTEKEMKTCITTKPKKEKKRRKIKEREWNRYALQAVPQRRKGASSSCRRGVMIWL